MCVPALSGIGLAKSALGGGNPGLAMISPLAAMLSKKKGAATDPNAGNPAYAGVSAKRAMKTAMLVGQRNAAAAGGY